MWESAPLESICTTGEETTYFGGNETSPGGNETYPGSKEMHLAGVGADIALEPLDADWRQFISHV